MKQCGIGKAFYYLKSEINLFLYQYDNCSKGEFSSILSYFVYVSDAFLFNLNNIYKIEVIT